MNKRAMIACLLFCAGMFFCIELAMADVGEGMQFEELNALEDFFDQKGFALALPFSLPEEAAVFGITVHVTERAHQASENSESLYEKQMRPRASDGGLVKATWSYDLPARGTLQVAVYVVSADYVSHHPLWHAMHWMHGEDRLANGWHYFGWDAPQGRRQARLYAMPPADGDDALVYVLSSTSLGNRELAEIAAGFQ